MLLTTSFTEHLQQTPAFQLLEWSNINYCIGEISDSLHILKNLGRGMHTHLMEEDELLDRISEKTQKADMTIEKQNKQLRNLLK